jgi:mRNA interferase MazF
MPVEPPFQWQIVRAQLDPVQGSEQAGERPVIIVSREAANAALPVVTVLPLTSLKLGRRVYATEVLLGESTAGLPQKSLAMAQQIRTLAKSRLLYSYGWLDDEALRNDVRRAMRVYLDLD